MRLWAVWDQLKTFSTSVTHAFKLYYSKIFQIWKVFCLTPKLDDHYMLTKCARKTPLYRKAPCPCHLRALSLWYSDTVLSDFLKSEPWKLTPVQSDYSWHCCGCLILTEKQLLSSLYLRVLRCSIVQYCVGEQICCELPYQQKSVEKSLLANKLQYEYSRSDDFKKL